MAVHACPTQARSIDEENSMRLDYLCDIQFAFNEMLAQTHPYGGEEGSIFVLGSGIVAGERLRGRARCGNHAHRRNDGAMMPEITGAITTDDNATILFSMHGLTTWIPTSQGPKGNQVSWISFETDAEQYRWLNDARCVMEGAVQLHPERGASGPTRIYICINEMV
jgi:Protein of unknown function (DUF3237)